jgi:hypothetical protein
VLQTSLDDFYISYEINAYIKEPNKQALIYSMLHQNIQDICNERGIEIMCTLPRCQRWKQFNNSSNLLDKEYKAPSFNVNFKVRHRINNNCRNGLNNDLNA